MRHSFTAPLFGLFVLIGAAQAAPPRATHVTTLAELPGGSGGVVVDAKGHVYSADFGTALGPQGKPGTRVYRITPAGEVSVFAEGLEGASGNAIDSQGRFYQSNIRGNTISRIAADGTKSTFVEGLINPVGIVIDEDDTLWVANCGGGTIQKVTADGASTVFARSELLRCPNGMARDKAGNLYTANFYNGDVIKITPDATVSVLTTLPGGNNGHLTFAHGRLYVVDRAGQKIYAVTLDGKATVLAGSGKKGGKDGPAAEAEFCFPNDIAASPDGRKLYVNEVADEDSDGYQLEPTRVRVIHLKP